MKNIVNESKQLHNNKIMFSQKQFTEKKFLQQNYANELVDCVKVAKKTYYKGQQLIRDKNVFLSPKTDLEFNDNFF